MKKEVTIRAYTANKRMTCWTVAIALSTLTLPVMAEAQSLNLSVPGPDFSQAAKQYADSNNETSSNNHSLIHLPAETQGFDVHGSVSTGVMVGSHHTSGEYTSGQVQLSRGNTSILLGVSQMNVHGRGPAGGGPFGPGPYNGDSYGVAAAWGP